MKKIKLVLLFFSITIIFLTSYILYMAVLPDSMDDMQVENSDLNEDVYSVSPLLTNVQPQNLADSFNYHEYLNHVSLSSINSITKNLAEIDTFTHDPIVGQKIIALALTDSLFNRISTRLEKYNDDSLIQFMQTIQSYKYYAKYPGSYQTFYDVVFSWWISKMSNLLDSYAIENNDIKFSFKYKFLAAHCKMSQSNVSPKSKELEKIVNNIAEQKWSYLYKRLWNTPIFLRIFLLLIGVITLVSYCLLINAIIHKFKKSKS